MTKKRHSHIYATHKIIKCFKCRGIRGEIMFCTVDGCRKRITRHYECDCQGNN